MLVYWAELWKNKSHPLYDHTSGRCLVVWASNVGGAGSVTTILYKIDFYQE